jgi:hypothetical protein
VDRRRQGAKEGYELGDVVVMVRARSTCQHVETTAGTPLLEGADYSFYDRFRRKIDGETELGTDVALLLADLRFSAAVEPGLELADIVVNATRRALVGSLGQAGWRGIPRLMIHRGEPYIHFMSLRQDGSDMIRHPPYAPIVQQFFASGGRSMLAPRFLRAAMA